MTNKCKESSLTKRGQELVTGKYALNTVSHNQLKQGQKLSIRT